MKSPLRILHLEDSDLDRELIRLTLEADGLSVRFDSRVQLPLILQGNPDVTLAAGERRVEPERLLETGDGRVQVRQGDPQVVAGPHVLRVGGHCGLEPPQPLAYLLPRVASVRVAHFH